MTAVIFFFSCSTLFRICIIVPWGQRGYREGRPRVWLVVAGTPIVHKENNNLEHNLKTSASARYRTYTKVTFHPNKQPTESTTKVSSHPKLNKLQNLHESVFPSHAIKYNPSIYTKMSALPTHYTKLSSHSKNNLQNLNESVFPLKKKQSTESTRKCLPPKKTTYRIYTKVPSH